MPFAYLAANDSDTRLTDTGLEVPYPRYFGKSCWNFRQWGARPSQSDTPMRCMMLGRSVAPGRESRLGVP